MNLKTFITVAIIATAMMTSCGKGDPTENEPTPVKFTADVSGHIAEPLTRAAGTAWDNGDRIGIYMLATGTTNISGGVNNREYVTAGGNSFAAVSPADVIYFPLSGSAVDFIAYYPYRQGLANFIYNVDVSSQSSQANIDLLYSNNATNRNQSLPSVPLNFSHKLVKVILNTIDGDGLTPADLQGMDVSFTGMNTTATFDLRTGTLGALGTPDDITPHTTTAGSKYEAIILPAAIAAGAVTMEFAIGVEKFIWEVPATTFAAGTQYTYDITITRTGISVTGSIAAWTAGPNFTGTAE
jgi:hypothetical protein